MELEQSSTNWSNNYDESIQQNDLRQIDEDIVLNKLGADGANEEDMPPEDDEEKRGAANVRERKRMCGINVAFLVGF